MKNKNTYYREIEDRCELIGHQHWPGFAVAAGLAGVLVVLLGAAALAGLAAVPPLLAVVLTVFPAGLGGILLL